MARRDAKIFQFVQYCLLQRADKAVSSVGENRNLIKRQIASNRALGSTFIQANTTAILGKARNPRRTLLAENIWTLKLCDGRMKEPSRFWALAQIDSRPSTHSVASCYHF